MPQYFDPLILPRVSALPAAASLGRMYVLTTDGHVYQENGTIWDDLTAQGSGTAPTGTKTSALTAASAAVPTMELPVNDAGINIKLSISQILTLIGNTINNKSIADQQIAAGISAQLTGSTLSVPPELLRAGTIFKWKLAVSKTAAGTAANTFIVRLGTSGTVSDPAILTFTTSAGTAVVDTGFIEIVVTIRAATQAATAQGIFVLSHNLSATGLATVPVNVARALSAAFNATTPNLIASLSCTTAASTVLTFHQVIAEAINL
jgi:hypothetical protein